jgi:hypothetical protein
MAATIPAARWLSWPVEDRKLAPLPLPMLSVPDRSTARVAAAATAAGPAATTVLVLAAGREIAGKGSVAMGCGGAVGSGFAERGAGGLASAIAVGGGIAEGDGRGKGETLVVPMPRDGWRWHPRAELLAVASQPVPKRFLKLPDSAASRASTNCAVSSDS